MKPAALQRHYGMDWLRVGAFVLLIIYHVGFSFTPWGFQTPSRGVVSWAEIPLLGLSSWRLALLFAISGYASAALLRKDGDQRAFFKSRMLRLGIPLLFGLTVIVPPQPYLGLVHSGYGHGYGYFLLHDAFSFRKVGFEDLPTTMHMWFVIYLLAYTAALCAALAWLPAGWLAKTRSITERLFSGRLLLPLGIGLIFVVRLLPYGWTDIHSFMLDRAAHLHYFGMFLFGFVLRGSETIRQAIASQWKVALGLSVLAYGWVIRDCLLYPGNIPTPAEWQQPLSFAKSVQCWGMVIALFGIADRFWNFDSKWRATLVEAVFPIYIAHQTVMVIVSYWVRDKGLTALPEFLFLCGSVAAGSWLFYLVGREVGPLRPLIGLKRHRPIRVADVEVAAVTTAGGLNPVPARGRRPGGHHPK